ncbi:hypothetical protein B0H13DRAFT_512886 [Mycena leptocephala]|nr:hypothetical protein B0H13DRAFT_512886 [Mycena leptocephala]
MSPDGGEMKEGITINTRNNYKSSRHCNISLFPTPTMDRSSTASSSRASPFSLVEFGNLVSAALDSPDPLLSFSSSPLFSLSNGTDNAPLEDEQSNSRVRQMLKKFKKRASAFVKRPSTHPAEETRASSPEYRIPELRLSSDVSCAEFVPYLPLVAQYERRTPYIRQISTCRSLPIQYSSRSLYAHSNSSHSSFAASPSGSSCYSGSTSSESQYPLTPPATVSEKRFPARCWSAYSTDESLSDPDPFAKPPVRVVARSLTAPTQPLRRRGRLPLSPAKPPPGCPIPAPPLPFHTYPARSTHPYRHAQPVPLPFPESPSPVSRAYARRAARSSVSLLDAFPAPPTHMPTPTPPGRRVAVVTARARHSRSRLPRAVPIGSTSSRHRARSSWPPRRPARALTATRRAVPRLGTATSFTARAPASDIFLYIHPFVIRSPSALLVARDSTTPTPTPCRSFSLHPRSFLESFVHSHRACSRCILHLYCCL